MSTVLIAPAPPCAPPPSVSALDCILKRYLRNLAALYRQDAELAGRLEAMPFGALPALLATRAADEFTISLRADDGQMVHCHSRYQPRAEAARFVAEQPRVENPTFFVAGLGLGYVVLELERRYKRAIFVVSEPDLALLKCALCACDFAPLLNEGRLILLTRADKGLIHDRLDVCNADLMLGIQFIVSPYARRCQAALHSATRDLLMDFISYSRMQMVTLLKNSRTTVRNVTANLTHYLRSPGIEALKDRARGCPAIVVSAGPSLARNLDVLRGLRNNAVIIAVQTIYKLLSDLGVPPHFVTSLDYHAVSAEYFLGVSPDTGTVLVAEPKAAPDVLDIFTGRRVVLHHEIYDALLQGAGPQHGGLRAGSTVAHLSYYLAVHLGCDPIILVGQDLAYSEGLYYLPGTPIERTWQVEAGRFNTMEMRQLERLARFRPILRRIRDIHGRATYTDDLLFSYLEQFEAEFARTSARVIQASEGGAPLRGARIMSLRAAADEFCQRALPADLLELPIGGAGAVSQSAVGAMQQRRDELEQVRRIAVEMLARLDELPPLLVRPAEFNRRIARIDELRLQMQRRDRIYRLVTGVAQQAELRRHSLDKRIAAAEDDEIETARRRIERDREYVQAFLDGCEFLAGAFENAAQRLWVDPEQKGAS